MFRISEGETKVSSRQALQQGNAIGTAYAPIRRLALPKPLNTQACRLLKAGLGCGKDHLLSRVATLLNQAVQVLQIGDRLEPLISHAH